MIKSPPLTVNNALKWLEEAAKSCRNVVLVYEYMSVIREATIPRDTTHVGIVRLYNYHGVALTCHSYEAVLLDGANVRDGDLLYTPPAAKRRIY